MVSLTSMVPKQQFVFWLLLLVYFVFIVALHGCDTDLILRISSPSDQSALSSFPAQEGKLA